MTKCMNDPAASTTARWWAGRAWNARPASAGSISSSEVIPSILTNPPAGNALIPYSVSPRVRDHSVGPNPTKNFDAFIP